MSAIMIISGESSGELYGALLANALKSKWPDVHIIGIGGQRMSEAGVELVSRISDAFGIIEAVASLGKLKKAFNNAVEALNKFRPDVLVLIDYPDFNLKVAKKAKALGIKVLYYVSPQVWAWRKGRVPKIASLVNRMAVLLPFEEKIYKDAGLQCDFVGHPILEEIQGVLAKGDKAEFKTALGLDPVKPLLSLLPGSRPHELNKLLPLMIEVVRQFRNDPEILKGNKEYQFCMPLAPNTDEQKYYGFLETLKKEGVTIKKGESVKVLAASDMAVVASGTATLQTAFLEVPMVVVYKMSPLEFQIGKRIIDVKHISLVNILAGKDVVVELLQERANPGETLKELKKIIFDMEYRGNMINQFREIKGPFIGKKASQRVADIILEMVIWRK
jgi:lipid-A-disaccharide synthase